MEKEKKQEYGHECYKNLSGEEKQQLDEYRKKYYRMKKKRLIIKNNDLESSFEAINLLQQAHLD